MGQNWSYVSFEGLFLDSFYVSPSPSPTSSWILALGKANHHVLRALKQPVEVPTCGGNDASYQQPIPTWLACEWATLKVDPQAPVKPLDDYRFSSYSVVISTANSWEAPGQNSLARLTHTPEKWDHKCLGHYIMGQFVMQQ